MNARILQFTTKCQPLLALMVGLMTTVQAVASGTPVVGWGANSYGQSTMPADVTNVVSLAAGGYHSLALKSNGRVAAWGNYTSSQTNVPSILNNAAAVAAGLNHSVALRSNGTAVVWGSPSYGLTYPPSSLTNAAAIAAGWYHNLALASNGTVTAWGAGTYQGSSPHYGQSMVPANLTGVTAVAAGGFHSLALRSNGTVVAWGWNQYRQTNVPAGLSNVIAIAAGGSNSIALKNDGTLVAWGNNTYGQTNVPEGLSNVVAIAAGAAHNLALKSDGTLVAWGLNGSGQTEVPTDLTNVTAISAGAFHNLALINNGPVTFPGGPTFSTVLKGDDATLTMPVLGDGPLAYEWVHNGIPVPNGTNGSLTILNAQLSDAGNYQLIASNVFGAVSSPVIAFVVQDTAPFFTLQPASRSVLQNSNATLSVGVGGIPPITWQWQFNGTNLPGATNLALTVTNAQLANEGYYTVVASNSYGTATSSRAFLNVIDVPEALGATNLVWYNPPISRWFTQSTNTHDGVGEVAVALMPSYSSSSLQTFVRGSGTVSFWYHVYNGAAGLTFLVDGVAVFSSADRYWTQRTVYLVSGPHTLTWKAANNMWQGTDLVFLDDVVFTPGPAAPVITSQPGNPSPGAGYNATLSLSAGGTPPLSYQWYGKNQLIPGTTNSSLTLSNVQASDAGAYYAVVTNDWGRVQSVSVNLTVAYAAPLFTAQPQGACLLLGSQATLRGATVGSAPVAYQWLRNGVPLPDATNTSLTLTNLQAGDAGTYSLLASNWLGIVSSSNALLTLYALADLSAAVDSPGLAWSTTNVPWLPQTNTTHDGVSAAQSGAISGSQSSTLQTIVNGPATITYWWKVNCESFWVNLAFRLDGAVQNAIAGTVDWQQATNFVGPGSHAVQWDLYPIHDAFAGGTGWVDQVQILAGSTPASILTHPATQTNTAGNSVSFSVGAIGTPPLRYQWQFNGEEIPGATNTTLTLSNLQADQAGLYAAVVANDVSFAVSSNAALVVNSAAPLITAQPAKQSRVNRSSATFSVAAKGSMPLNYQWQFNGADIPGATSATLLLTNLQFSDAGAYTAVVTNAFGAVTSAVARLETSATMVVDYWPSSVLGYSQPPGLGIIKAIAAGQSHTVGLRPDGTVISWGNAYYGLTNVPAGLSNVIAISAGDFHTVALKADGTVVAWGDNSFGQSLVPDNLSNVIAIAAAANNTLALKSDGTVVGWGRNTDGQLDIPPGLTNVQAVAAGIYNGFVIGADGTVTQWGNGPVWPRMGVDAWLVVAPGSNDVSAVAAGAYAGYSLHNDGSVRGWGWVLPGHQIYQSQTIAAIASAGPGTSTEDYLMTLTCEGIVNPIGQLPSGSSSPVIPPGVTNAVAIAAAYGHAAVLVNDGAPSVLGQPVSRMFPAGATTLLRPGVVGPGPMSYQWRFDGTDIPGATNATLQLGNLGVQNAGAYDVVAMNAFGVVTGSVTRLSVTSSQPIIQTAGEGFGFSQGKFGFDFSGPAGQAVVIETSTDLQAWTPLQTNVLVNGQAHFTDAQSGLLPNRFYRARLLP